MSHVLKGRMMASAYFFLIYPTVPRGKQLIHQIFQGNELSFVVRPYN